MILEVLSDIANIWADYTQIYLSCPPSKTDSGINRIAHDVGVIASYADDNGLELNLTNCTRRKKYVRCNDTTTNKT